MCRSPPPPFLYSDTMTEKTKTSPHRKDMTNDKKVTEHKSKMTPKKKLTDKQPTMTNTEKVSRVRLTPKQRLQNNTIEAMFRDLQSNVLAIMDTTTLTLGGQAPAKELDHQRAVLGLFFVFREELQKMIKSLRKAKKLPIRHAAAAKITRITYKYIRSLKIAEEFKDVPATYGEWTPKMKDNLMGVTDTVKFAFILTGYMETLHYIMIDNLDNAQRKNLVTKFRDEYNL